MAARDIIQAAAGAAGATEAVYVEDVFSTYLYTGTGASQTITNGIDLATKGGLVWIKIRDSDYSNILVDNNRVGASFLSTNTTEGLTYSNQDVTAFTTSGFTVGLNGRVNQDISLAGIGKYASWTFRKQPKFFDVVTFSVTASTNQRVSHALGVTPGLILVKKVSGPQDWYVYHKSLGRSYFGLLNSTDTFLNVSNVWGTTDPTSTDFGMWSSYMLGSTGDYVAYLFADSNSGGFGPAGTDSVVACGSYTGNGSASGPTVTLGWEPQWVLVKEISTSSYNWVMYDNMRGMAVGAGDPVLFPNQSSAEAGAANDYLDPTATGFVLKSTAGFVNSSGSTYIYLAIRRGPMKTPTDATKVFAVDLGRDIGSASSPSYSAPITVDMALQKNTTSSDGTLITSRLTSGQSSYTNSTGAEFSTPAYTFNYQTGWANLSSAQTSYVSWMFRRAPGFMDCVCYTGNGATRNIAHNLGVAPELIITKQRDGTQFWCVMTTSLAVGSILILNATSALENYGFWSSAPTSTTYNVTSEASLNFSGGTYVAYLFATCPGVSKVGSYTGSGTTKQIDCGFTAGARFILIKRTDSTGSWYVWDTARGIDAGNDPYLLLNSIASQNTTTDYIDPYSAGFEISSTAPADINASGGTYIYLAIA